MADEDLPLVLALQNGDDHALDEIMARHKDPIFRFVYRHVSNEADAAELTQETFIRAYFHISSFKPQARFSSWLYTIAGNLCRDHLKSRSRRDASRTYSLSADSEDKPIDLAAATPTPDETAERNERIESVEAAINQLPFELRSALVLTTIDGASHAEAAEKLGTTSKAIENRVHRARKRLEKILHIF